MKKIASKKVSNKAFKARINSVAALYSNGQIQETLDALNILTAQYPNESLPYNIRAACYAGLGQLDVAVANLEHALKLNPHSAEVHYNLGNASRDLGQLEQAVVSYERALELKPDLSPACYNLANALKDLGQLDAAVQKYQQALKINPNHSSAHNNLGIVLKDLGQLDEALKSFKRALKIDPDKHTARHMVNSILGHNSESPPKEYIANLFDQYAHKFEDSLVKKLDYNMPLLLKQAYLGSGLASKEIHKAIDLGCGTGLCGIEFRGLVEILIGIDLSKKMVQKAAEKNIYDELYVNDLISGLQTLETKFDLFISSDVFVYIGNLIQLLETIKKHANKGSILIFSTEYSEIGDFNLQPTGRYSHSKRYITTIASNCGFQLKYFKLSNFRKEKDQWIVGGIYILKSI